MAARGTNTSLAAELMQLIDEEEYIQLIPRFENDDYLNKNEVSSLKKMTSGKLWVDNRKFVTRQNNPITSGLFELIGNSVSKSASDTKAESCDFLLDPDNKDVRQILKCSLKTGDFTYSKWTSKLSDEDPPCDATTLYLVCRTYKRHAVVLTSSKIWSTFKAGNRTTLDMFVKADFVLLWLGDNKFAEVKPLKTVTNTLGPLVEWQLLSDSIKMIHDKRATERKARKPRQPKPKPPQSPRKTQSVSTPRKGEKRKSKINIDYKSMHNVGLSVGSPKKRKILPSASGPSESRIASQRMITRELLQKQTQAKGLNTTATIIGTCIKAEDKEDKKSVKRAIKQETENKEQLHKRIKLEATDIHMVHRTNPAESTKRWNYIHPSGSPCGRKHRLRGNLRSDELPDLVLPVPTSINPNAVVQSPVSTPQVVLGDLEQLPKIPTQQGTKDRVNIPDVITPRTNTGLVTNQASQEAHETYKEPSVTSTPAPLVPPSTTTSVSTPRTNKDPITNQQNEAVGASTPALPMPPDITRLGLHDQPVSERMEAEMQTANTLLELHETLDTPFPDPNLPAEYDNSDIMPVNAPPAPDYSKDYPLPTNIDEANPDETVEYADEDENIETNETVIDPPDSGTQPTPSSPTGRFRYRHHGIRRNLGSPKIKHKKYRCIYCPVVEESKRELNAHHRSSHGIMFCVDCNKSFPTPDALQRHRYIHQQNREQFKCDLCGYITAFESDMKRHKVQHEDEKTWYCDDPNCSRTFKRKLDMTSHAKTHTNEDQRCPAQGCDYTNKDARNLKRHMKCHSNEKPLKCSMCPERFKHYQQLKRHKENHP